MDFSVRRRLLPVACLALSFFVSGCTARSSDSSEYPSRPVSYLVPWNPGGGTDTASRAMAAVLSDVIGQPVNVVNRTGGGGVIGHLAIAQAAPDGYTIGAVTVEITMMHWLGLTDLTYADYTPLAMLMNNPASVIVRADAPWNDVTELLDDVRANPGRFQASGTSRGGIWDLARMGMLEAAGLPQEALPWVPSQGAAPALQELIAGGVDVVTIALAEGATLLNVPDAADRQVKALAVMADERLAQYPNVPTLKEQGVDWSLGGWVAVGGPAGMPDSVRTRIIDALREASESPAYIQSLGQAGFNLQFLPGDEFGALMARDDERHGALLRDAGMAVSSDG